MGALHEGHAEPDAGRPRARRPTGPVVVSVFVNPLQFGPGEDLDRYPRTLDADLEVCEREGVDVVFAPVGRGGLPRAGAAAGHRRARARWPRSSRGDPARPLPRRATVVAKLFGLVRPDVAVFGEKDYQQLVLIRRMVADLCLGVEVVGAETCASPTAWRCPAATATSTPTQRRAAAALSGPCGPAQAAAAHGVDAALGAARAELRAQPGVDLDYLVLTDP